jgi:3-oxoacyl-[acyl-carrier protein] reductase
MSRILVTGGASGIGRELVGALARAGHRVLAADVQLDGLAKATADDGWPASVETTFLDVTSESDWTSALDRADAALGGLDVVYNVAGLLAPGFVGSITARDVERLLAVNVRGVILGTNAVARRMIDRGVRGHVVNVGSLASLSPVPGLSLYCATKWAVRGFSLSAAIELETHGIAVTLVCPDAVDTPMLDQQRDREEAALTFSGSRSLTTREVVEVLIGRVLRDRPLEVAIPEHRGLLARAAGAMPASARTLYPLLKRQGLAGQSRSAKR